MHETYNGPPVNRTACELTGTKSAPGEQTGNRGQAAGLKGKRAAVVVFSHYPSDPRPRRAAEALAQAGMQVEVISLRQDDNEPLHDSCNGVSIRRIPLKHTRGGKINYVARYGLFILASFLLLGFRSFTRRGYSLVHVHNMPDVLVFAALIPKLLGARVILDLHDPMPELMMTIFGLRLESFGVKLLKRLEKLSIAVADAVLTPNAAFEKLFVSRSCRKEKIGVILNVPDEQIFKFCEPKAPAKRTAETPFVIMYHGALVERHGLDLAVMALEKIKAKVPKVQLRVYGRRTPFLDSVMAMVAERGLQDAVQYFGPKSLQEISEAIDACDVGVIPNRRSLFTELNLPTRIFEYLARGKAAIVPRTPGVQDYFDDSELFLFDLGDGEDLARQLEAVALQAEAAFEITKRGQEVYRTHTWTEERLRFLGLVQQLVLPARGSRALSECRVSETSALP